MRPVAGTNVKSAPVGEPSRIRCPIWARALSGAGAVVASAKLPTAGSAAYTEPSGAATNRVDWARRGEARSRDAERGRWGRMDSPKGDRVGWRARDERAPGWGAAAPDR